MPLKTIKMDQLAAGLLTFAVFTLTLWRFGTNQCLALLVLMVLFYRPWRQELFSWSWLKNPVILLALFFVGFCLLSVSYSETPRFADALKGVSAYSKLLFLGVIPIAFREARYRKWLENGLIYGVFVNVIISTLYYYQLPIIVHYFGAYMDHQISFTVNPIQMIYVAVMAIWLLAMRLLRREFHYGDVIVFAALLAYLWLINMERSGYVLFLALILLLLGQKFGKKAVFVGGLIIPLVLVGLYFAVPNIKFRLNEGIHNVLVYQQTENTAEMGVGDEINNSWGLRLALATECIGIIKNHPILGTGAGSFKYVYGALYPAQQAATNITEPHDIYIYILFEFGLLGLTIFLVWLYAVLKWINTLPSGDRHLLQGVWLMFVVLGFTDSSLILNAVGLSLVVWISLYLNKHVKPLRQSYRL